MDLLSLVGLATRQRPEYFKQAERLAKKYQSLEKIEERMAAESKAVVRGLRDRQVKFDEYERTLVDKTITAALAAVYLGAGGSRPKEKMEGSWASIVGNMLPPLKGFMDETKIYLDNGILKFGDDSIDFADYDYDIEDSFGPDENSDELVDDSILEALEKRSIGQTWPAVFGRVKRYISTPLYSFYSLGEFLKNRELGFKEMRRIPRLDKRTCADCIAFGEEGWQPIGSLPMPGKDCRCFDRCRCSIEYR
jgi:hypothetical protein